MNSVFGWASDLPVSVPQSLDELPSRKINLFGDNNDEAEKALKVKPGVLNLTRTSHRVASNSRGVSESWKNPEIAKRRVIRHSVEVEGHGVFSSTNAAFLALGLPTARCIRFRILLKEAGELTFEHEGVSYRFRAREASEYASRPRTD